MISKLETNYFLMFDKISLSIITLTNIGRNSTKNLPRSLTLDQYKIHSIHIKKNKFSSSNLRE